MRNKKLIIFYITAICLIVGSLLYTSYGFYIMKISGTDTSKKISAITRVLKIEYSGGDESLFSSMEDYFIPGSTITKNFTITNKGNTTLYYNILLDDLRNNFTRVNDLEYELLLNGNSIVNDIFPTKNNKYLANNLKIEIDETQNFTLIVNYKKSTENQIADSGKVIGGNITFEESKDFKTKLNIYGNTITTLAEGATGITPDTPQTITSLGSLVTDTTDSNYGKYKIDITSKGKNLMPEDMLDESSYVSLKYFSHPTVYFFPELEPNKTYTVSLDYNKVSGDTYYYIYKIQNNAATRLEYFIVNTTKSGKMKYTFTAEEGAKYAFYGNSTTYLSRTLLDITNVQLEEGSTATDYEPYKESITNSIYLDEPLRCIDSTTSACDYIDLVNRTVNRNIGKVVYDGNENFSLTSGTYWHKGGVTTAFAHPIPENALSNSFGMPVISNMFTFDSTKDGIDNTKPYISGNIGQIILAVNNTTATTVSGLQSFLTNNNLQIIYQLSSTDSKNIILPNIPISDNRLISVSDGVVKASKVEYE